MILLGSKQAQTRALSHVLTPKTFDAADPFLGVGAVMDIARVLIGKEAHDGES